MRSIDELENLISCYCRLLLLLLLPLETYSPQVIIKSRIDPPFLAEDYFLQCNARGNPLPRLYWTKQNQIIEYLPNTKQCLSKTCRIYSIQSKYQSTLYFHSLTLTDSGVYTCRTFENRIYSYKSRMSFDF